MLRLIKLAAHKHSQMHTHKKGLKLPKIHKKGIILYPEYDSRIAAFHEKLAFEYKTVIAFGVLTDLI